MADASVTKVFSSEQLQVIGQELAEAVGRHGDAADPDTAALMTWLDVQLKRNIVLTFGGGVNEIQRELIATARPRPAAGAPMSRGRDPGGRRPRSPPPATAARAPPATR